MIRKAFVTMLLCVGLSTLMAQSNYPVIGNPMPQFSFSNVHYYKNKTFSNKDLVGKWTIMDFWTKNCSACVGFFPKVNQLQQEFKNEVQFILIGKNDHAQNKNTQAIYERYRKNKNLELPIAYDSITFDQFGIHGVPHIIVVDPQANVYAVTGASVLTHENLSSLVAGDNPAFEKKYSRHETVSASAQPQPWKYLVNEKQRPNDVLYRSLLTINNGEPTGGYNGVEYTVSQGLFQHSRFNLKQFYNIAYFGMTGWHRYMPMYNNYWPYPLLEVSDSAAFEVNYQKHTGLYNYSIMVPVDKSSKQYLMTEIQHDLKTYFGYEASIETRVMPYWRLTATDEAKKKLVTKSSTTEDYRDPSGITAKRISIGLVLSQIEEYNMDNATSLPFIDETGITQPIDIHYRAVLTDLNEVTKELKKLGLILEKSKKEMKVLVIRDPQSVSN